MRFDHRVKGGIMGVVVGDALGLPVQFLTREEVRRRPVTRMIGYGAFDMPPGTWSDDTSLTLCLLESLTEKGYDLADIGDRFVRWLRDGYMTPFGYAFDVGGTTAEAMTHIMDGVDPLQAGPTHEWSQGNGSLMRILPAVLYYQEAPLEKMLEIVCAISRITHAHPSCQLACCLYAFMARHLLNGKSRDDAYRSLLKDVPKVIRLPELKQELPKYERILDGNLPSRPESEIRSTGYVVDTLEAALWVLLMNHTFADTVLAAVNLGEDTDTVAAVAGGAAGVYYGIDSIPGEWIETVIHASKIQAMISRFIEAAAQAQQ